MTDIDRSNSLTDLAARIKAEHEAVSVALKDSVRHAIAAGEMLIEAKEQLKHGQWLPWLNEHCTISERTAQLYMRTARNREAIEANAQSVADLTLNEAAALLAMSSDMKKLLEFAKEASKLTDPEEFFQFCAANDVACMQGNIFNAPEPTPQEAVEWGLFRLFLVRECAFSPEGAYYHADWVQSRGTLLKDWMGEMGIQFAATCGTGPTQQTVDRWKLFLDANGHRTIGDVDAEFKREDQARIEALRNALKTGKLNGRKLSSKNRRLGQEEVYRSADRIG